MITDHHDLVTWQRIRRYAVPARMIEACTRAREAGDWRAACVAADIEEYGVEDEYVDEHLQDKADRHGDNPLERIYQYVATWAKR